ncbi:MAG: hypothetical protein AAGC74_08075 [Verrucomicrobiota bacterium]
MKKVANRIGSPFGPKAPFGADCAKAFPKGEIDSKNGNAIVTPAPLKKPLRLKWLERRFMALKI